MRFSSAPPDWETADLMAQWFPARKPSPAGPCDDLAYIANVVNFGYFPIHFPMSASWLWGRVTEFMER